MGIVALERIDAVQIDTIEAGGDDPVEIARGLTEDGGLPGRVPVTNVVIAFPFGVFAEQP